MFAGLKIMSTFATQMRNKLTQSKCPDGGIGRRVGLKHQWIHFHPGSIPGLGTRKKSNDSYYRLTFFYFQENPPKTSHFHSVTICHSWYAKKSA